MRQQELLLLHLLLLASLLLGEQQPAMASLTRKHLQQLLHQQLQHQVHQQHVQLQLKRLPLLSRMQPAFVTLKASPAAVASEGGQQQQHQHHIRCLRSGPNSSLGALRMARCTSSSGSSSSSRPGEMSPFCRMRLLDAEARRLFPGAVPLACTEVPLPSSSSSNSKGEEVETWYFLLHGILGSRRNLRGLASALPPGRAFCFDLRCHGSSGRGPLSLPLMSQDLLAQIWLMLKDEARSKHISPAPVAAVNMTSSSSSSCCCYSKLLELPHWRGMEEIKALFSALKKRLVLIGHSMGGLTAMQAGLDGGPLNLFGALVILDISPSPFCLIPESLASDPQHVAAKESTAIFIPSSSSSSSGSSSRVYHEVSCCQDVGRVSQAPREGAYSSAALVGVLSDVWLPAFASKLAVAKALQQLQPPVKPAVLSWLLMSLTTEAQRRAELEHLLRDNKPGVVDTEERQRQGVLFPEEEPRPPLLPAQQQQQQQQGGERLMWQLDLPKLQSLVSSLRSLGLAAIPLSLHDQRLSVGEQQRPAYRGPTLFLRAAPNHHAAHQRLSSTAARLVMPTLHSLLRRQEQQQHQQQWYAATHSSTQTLLLPSLMRRAASAAAAADAHASACDSTLSSQGIEAALTSSSRICCCCCSGHRPAKEATFEQL
ncbi:hypothetical protein Esti_006786 [Eimeria stiedai]